MDGVPDLECLDADRERSRSREREREFLALSDETKGLLEPLSEERAGDALPRGERVTDREDLEADLDLRDLVDLEPERERVCDREAERLRDLLGVRLRERVLAL